MELQSGMDFTMPFRLLVYMVNMWEQYFRNVPEEVRERKDFHLPVVVPMVLYNGKDNWTAQRRFRDYLRDGDSFGEYGVNFQYALIDVRRLAKDLILNTNTVIDNIFYLDRAKGKEDFLRAVEEMMDRVAELPADEKNLMEIWFAHVLEGRFGKKEQDFIRQCFQKGEKKMISGFEQIVIEEKENARKEGMEQGIERGIRQGIERGASREKEHGIQVLLKTCREFGQSAETAAEKLVQSYDLPAEEARELAERYWKNG